MSPETLVHSEIFSPLALFATPSTTINGKETWKCPFWTVGGHARSPGGEREAWKKLQQHTLAMIYLSCSRGAAATMLVGSVTDIEAWNTPSNTYVSHEHIYWNVLFSTHLSKILNMTQERWAQTEKETYVVYYFTSKNRHPIYGVRIFWNVMLLEEKFGRAKSHPKRCNSGSGPRSTTEGSRRGNHPS